MTTTHTKNSQNQIVSTTPPSQFKKTHRGDDNDFDYCQIRSEKSEPLSLKEINNENIVVECHDQTAKYSLGKPSISDLTQKQESTMAAEEISTGRERKDLDDESTVAVEESGRERLKRHRVEMAGRVWIPDIWGQEDLLKDWIDCTAFDASLVNNTILSARAALMQERRTPANSTTTHVLRRRIIENRC